MAEKSGLWCFIFVILISEVKCVFTSVAIEADLHSQTSLIFLHPDVNIMDSVGLNRNTDRLKGVRREIQDFLGLKIEFSLVCLFCYWNDLKN